MFFARPVAVVGLMGAVLVAGTLQPGTAAAQQIFRSVGPDGRVTFSDRPAPDAASRATTASVASAGASAGSELAALPFDLRQAASTYPVTLFSGPECAPCLQGQRLLASRGIPFAEKTVSTNEDIEALKRLVGAPTLPVLTIGGQQLKGFSEVEWGQYLDAAGYPKRSMLPPGYQPPAPSPLVAVHDVKTPPRPAPAAPAPRAPAPPPPAENGFQF